MKFSVDVTEAFIGDMGVDLGGSNVSMAQKLLDGSYINSLI